jgi:general secretion pathway protein L
MNMAGLGPERPGARLLPDLGNFWRRWWWSLLAWLPNGWRVFLGGAQERLLLAREGENLRVQRLHDGQLRDVGLVPLLAGQTRLDRLLVGRAALLPRWWLLDAGEGLRRRLRLPTAAVPQLRQVVGFEIDRQTPFAVEDVHFDVQVRRSAGDGQVEVELAVVPRRTIAALKDAAHGTDLGLAGIDLADAHGQPLGFNLLPAAERRWRTDRLWRWNLLLAAVAIIAILAAGGRILGNRQAVVDAMQAEGDRQLAQASRVATQRSRLVALVEGARFLEQTRAARPATVEVWDEVTRRLPDGTWLEKFSIESDQLLLTGLSDDAPALVARMEGARLWRKPALAGALQADPETGRNRFSLTAQLVATTPVATTEAGDDAARSR